jgi:hypothetical protein
MNFSQKMSKNFSTNWNSFYCSLGVLAKKLVDYNLTDKYVLIICLPASFFTGGLPGSRRQSGKTNPFPKLSTYYPKIVTKIIIDFTSLLEN